MQHGSDELFTTRPFFSSRRLTATLQTEWWRINLSNLVGFRVDPPAPAGALFVTLASRRFTLSARISLATTPETNAR